jgi:hypothetical protein
VDRTESRKPKKKIGLIISAFFWCFFMYNLMRSRFYTPGMNILIVLSPPILSLAKLSQT